jgi:FkbM family methyltransferase
MRLKNLIKRLLPSRLLEDISSIRKEVFDGYCLKSYSQEGEDMILNRIFEDKARGFYVDVGAHHPRRFSNTYFFYKRGWRGINIEPNPDASSLFRSARARDINIQLGVSDSTGQITYYQFDEPALNTFDSDIVNSRLARSHYKLKSTCGVQVERLDQILTNYLPADTQIDFLSIDVEGFDFAVLKSNDWERYRPKCVLVESLNTSWEDVMRGEIFGFMHNQQYVLFAKTYNTLFFLNAHVSSPKKQTGQMENLLAQ